MVEQELVQVSLSVHLLSLEMLRCVQAPPDPPILIFLFLGFPSISPPFLFQISQLAPLFLSRALCDEHM